MELEKAQFSLSVITSPTNTLLITDSQFCQQSDTLSEFLNGIYRELELSDRKGAIRRTSVKFQKRLASTLNFAAIQPRKKTYTNLLDKKMKISLTL